MAPHPDAVQAAPPAKERSPRGSLSSPARRGIVGFVLEHQLEISLVFVVATLAGNALTPVAPHLSTHLTPNPSFHLRSVPARFFHLSFRKPGTDLYYKGRDDAFFIAWWVIAFCFLREVVMRWIFEPIARQCGIKSRRALVRFAEQGWSLAYYACSWMLGLYINQTSPYASLNTLYFWKDYPHDALPALTKWYYLVSTAFYLNQIIVINLEAPRKDYYQMFAHHIITSVLMMFSYVLNWTRIGNTILCTMDLVDILLPLAKLFKYVGRHRASDATFATFMVFWIVTRHLIFGRIIWALLSEAPTILPFDWRSEDGYYFSQNTQRGFAALLLALQLLICMWLAMILRVLYNMFIIGTAEDNRSDDEDDDEDEEDAVKVNGHSAAAATEGQNLILNMADKGYTVCAYNRTVSKVDHFLENEAKGKSIVGAHSIEEFCKQLKRPRKIILLVKAGSAVDDFIKQLEPFLEEGDIIIDGGNSHFPDSNRRTKELEAKGLLFVGSGVSGGEEGARYGPSLMPGGSPAAWPHIKEIFQKTAAQTDGQPCCDWVGEEGAGHYVKMVHNGIEYGDMQLITEAYDILKRGFGMHEKEIAAVFETWNKGVLDSFLIEITTEILKYNDDDGVPLVTKILDSASQKGTGKWTATNALDLGMPVTLIGEAVFARCLSAIKDERVRASKVLGGPQIEPFTGDKKQFIDDLEQALYASKIISYAQGFMLMREAAKEYGWNLNNAGIALMWRGGCIIRSVFLGDITAAFSKKPDLENLLFDDFFNKAIHKAQPGWRRIVAQGALWGIPTPAFSTALSFFDGYRAERLPASLLQAQRDLFGAHQYLVLPEFCGDKYKEGVAIHTNWTGRGGNVSASNYAV
ncbi:hypothetical protein JCM3770_007036 [Rhodotorula araucariae]